MRRLHAELRRNKVALLFAQGINKAEIARRLSVHRSTISRDVQSFFDYLHRERKCPICRQKFRPVFFRPNELPDRGIESGDAAA